MNVENCRESLMAFINTSTSPYHAVNKCEVILRDAGFEALSLEDKWYLKEGDSYMVNVFGSSLIAFKVGKNMRKNLRIAAAHTDFPNIRIKPNPNIKREAYVSLNIETYGGLVLSTWIDRPLSIAGKVVLRSEDPFKPETVLVDFKRPVLTIPGLAIHMNRAMNDGVAFNRQTQMLPLAAEADNEYIKEVVAEGLRSVNFMEVLAKEVDCREEDILFYELGLYPTEQGCSIGFNEEYISSSRLDNLTSVKACLEGITHDVSEEGLHIIALFDNEEVGSRTKQGADSLVLPQILQRIYLALGYTLEECYEDVSGGFMLSADVAHGYHPNYSEKNDLTNKPVLNGGVVIKYACSQKYAGDAEAVGVVKALCEAHQIPCQLYVNRSDIVGGGTLGSIASAMLPMRTMDIGVPLLAMHSIRELMGERDQKAIEELMIAFFNR